MGEPTIYKPSIYNGAGIYKNGAAGGGGGGDLPAGYTRANYARSSGSVSLDFTDLNVNYNDKYVIELDLIKLQFGSLGFYVYGGGMALNPNIGSVDNSFFIPRYSYKGGTTSSVHWLDYSRGGLIKVTCNKKYCFIDCDQANYHKTIDRGSNANDSIIDNLTLFSFVSSGISYPLNGTIYSLKIFDKDNSDKLNADFIPCRDENNILGFYEKISGQFQGSANLVE